MHKSTTEGKSDGDNDIRGLLNDKIDYKESFSGKDNKFKAETHKESDINNDDIRPFKCFVFLLKRKNYVKSLLKFGVKWLKQITCFQHIHSALFQRFHEIK